MSYIEQYSTFGGADIIVSVGNVEFGTLQSISWATTRAKAPINVMNGSPDPIAYGRGIRTVAGQLSFVNLDRDAFLSYMEDNAAVSNPWISKNEIRANDADDNMGLIGSYTVVDSAWSAFNTAGSPTGGTTPRNAALSNYREQKAPEYADQILPFDVHISFTNEYGKAAKKSLLGVEIMNEGSGISIEDISLDSQYQFVARKVTKMMVVENNT